MMTTAFHSPRFDPFLPLHKAARHVMFEVLGQIGTLDTADIFAVDRCARQVARLVALLPGSADTLVPLLDALHQRDPAGRSAAAFQLYAEVTALVADALRHQQQLELVEAPRLRAHHSDAELRAMRRARLAAMDESDLADALRAMACALSPQELASVLDDLQASVDAQTFGCLVDTVRRQTGPERWARVARECGLSEAHAAPPARSRPSAGQPAANSTPLQRRLHRVERHRLLAQ